MNADETPTPQDVLEDAIAYLSARDRSLIDAARLARALREGRATYSDNALNEIEIAILDALNEQRGGARKLRTVRRTLG